MTQRSCIKSSLNHHQHQCWMRPRLRKRRCSSHSSLGSLSSLCMAAAMLRNSCFIRKLTWKYTHQGAHGYACFCCPFVREENTHTRAHMAMPAFAASLWGGNTFDNRHLSTLLPLLTCSHSRQETSSWGGNTCDNRHLSTLLPWLRCSHSRQ